MSSPWSKVEAAGAWVLSDLKTLLETGKASPSSTAESLWWGPYDMAPAAVATVGP